MDVIRETSRGYIDKFVLAGDVEVVDGGTTAFDFRLETGEDVRVENQVLKSITFEYILRDPRTVQIFHNGERVILRLYNEPLDNATTRHRRDRFMLFPRPLRDRLAMETDNQSALARLVCDTSPRERRAKHCVCTRGCLNPFRGSKESCDEEGGGRPVRPAEPSASDRPEGRGAQTMPDERHVVPAESGGWVVVKSGGKRAGRATVVFERRRDAERAAKDQVRERGGGEVVLHSRSGRITEKDTVTPARTDGSA